MLELPEFYHFETELFQLGLGLANRRFEEFALCFKLHVDEFVDACYVVVVFFHQKDLEYLKDVKKSQFYQGFRESEGSFSHDFFIVFD